MRTWTVEAGTPGVRAWVDAWFDAWFSALDAGLTHDLVDPVRHHAPEQLAELGLADPVVRRFAVVLEDDGHVLGAGRVHLPLRDNTDLALVEVAVPAHARRRGYGRALLRAVRDLVDDAGRTSVLAELDRPVDRSATDWPGSAFSRACGFSLRLTSVRRDLRLPLDDERASRLDAEVAAHASGYEIHAWAGGTPARDRDLLAALLARMTTDAPMGDLDYEPEVWDADRVAVEEARHVTLGRSWWTAVAVAPDGGWAAFSQLGWTPHEPERLHQWDTLVRAEHRGRRLGLAVKLACLRLASSHAPAARLVSTWNAAENVPMIAVNEAMGFRAVDVSEEWQADLGELRLEGARPQTSQLA